MESYPYHQSKNYLIIESGGLRFMIGTGVPDSMCTCGEVSIEGKSYPTHKQSLRMTTQQLSETIGIPLDGLLGADILSRFDYRINPFRKDVSFSLDEWHPYGYAYHFELYRSVPIVSIWIGPKEVPVFFNTASSMTFLAPEIASQYPLVGTSTVFYPGVGWFETPVHRVLVWLSGSDTELDVGIPPAALQITMKMTHTRGILGCDIFHGPGVFLASRRREIIWFWHDY